MRKELYVVAAKPVRLLKNGKVKRVKRKPNSLTALSTVSDFVYPGGNKKLVKDATTDPYAKNRRPRRKSNPEYVIYPTGRAAYDLSDAKKAAKEISKDHPGEVEIINKYTKRVVGVFRDGKEERKRKANKKRVGPSNPRKRTVKSKSNRKRRSSR